MTISPMTERDGKPQWGNPIHLLAYGLGSGAAPRAPGSVGTLAAVPLWLLIRPLPDPLYLILVGALFLLGVWICGRTAGDLGLKDPGGIVFDEWVGLFMTLWMLPTGWGWLLAGVLLFRLFDILKPWPIGWFDRRIGGGLGIMLDDLLAGLFAFALLQLSVYLW